MLPKRCWQVSFPMLVSLSVVKCACQEVAPPLPRLHWVIGAYVDVESRGVDILRMKAVDKKMWGIRSFQDEDVFISLLTLHPALTIAALVTSEM
jgi:hypothetical protein